MSISIFLLDQAVNLNELEPYTPSAWIYSIYCPINICILLFLLISTLAKQELRRLPGDICIGALFSELILSFHWMMMGAMHLVTRIPITHEHFFCQFNSSLGILGCKYSFHPTFLQEIGTIGYNLLFFLYLVFQLKNKAYTKKFQTWSTHLAIIFFSFGLLFIFFLTKQTGKNSSGWCTFIDGSYSLYISIALVLLFLVSTLLIIIYSKSKAKKYTKQQQSLPVESGEPRIVTEQISSNPLVNAANSPSESNSLDSAQEDSIIQDDLSSEDDELNYNRMRKNFFQFTNRFVIAVFIFWIGIQLMAIIEYLNCYYWQSTSYEGFYIVDVIFKVLYTTVIPLVRASEPKMKEYYKRLLNLYFSMNEISDDFVSMYAWNANSENKKMISSQIIQFRKDNKSRQTISRNPKALKRNVLTSLSSNEKNGILFRVMAFLIINQKVMFEKLNVDAHTTRSKQIFNERKVYLLRDSHLRKYVKIPKSFFNVKMWQDYMRVTAFAPIIFHRIQRCFSEKGIEIDVEQELNIEKNLHRMREACDDETRDTLVFFSCNNKYIIRQMTNYQREQFTPYLPNYYDYMISNKDTLIQPLFGIFLFEVLSSKMECQGITSHPISIGVFPAHQVPIRFISRSYALTGGRNDRNTLKKNERAIQEGMLLKDDDFRQFESGQLDLQQENLQFL